MEGVALGMAAALYGTSPSPIEQTALDLCRNRPQWNMTETTRTEMVDDLGRRINWDLIDDTAAANRNTQTLRRLRAAPEQTRP
jgi:hypothetical protein